MGGTTQTVERLLGIITVNTNQIPPDTSSLDISRSSFSCRNTLLRVTLHMCTFRSWALSAPLECGHSWTVQETHYALQGVPELGASSFTAAGKVEAWLEGTALF